MRHSVVALSVLTVVILSPFAAPPASAQDGDAAGVDAYISTSTAQFPGGVLVYPRTAYAVTTPNTSIDAFLELVGWTVNIDGLHVISLTEALFSVASADLIPTATGSVIAHPGRVYHADLSGGSPVIVEDPTWAALGLSLNNINALYFGGECFEFSPDSTQFLSPIGMIKPWQVFRACGGGPPELVFDAGNLAVNVDALHYTAGELEFSFRGLRFVSGGYIFSNQNTYRCSPTGAAKTCAPATVSLGFDGVGLGLFNLNAFSAVSLGDTNLVPGNTTIIARRGGYEVQCTQWAGNVCERMWIKMNEPDVTAPSPHCIDDTTSLRPIWHGDPATQAPALCWIATGDATVIDSGYGESSGSPLCGWMYSGGPPDCTGNRRYSTVNHPGGVGSVTWSFDLMTYCRLGTFSTYECNW